MKYCKGLRPSQYFIAHLTQKILKRPENRDAGAEGTASLFSGNPHLQVVVAGPNGKLAALAASIPRGDDEEQIWDAFRDPS